MITPRRGLRAGIFVLLLVLGACRPVVSFFSSGTTCELSSRPLHPETKIQFVLEGKRKIANACCLRCALTFAQQTHQAVQIVSVSDYFTHKPLDPARALFVVGSDVAPCVGQLAGSDGARACVVRAWDRCAPSVIAFATEAEVRRFVKLHGGRVVHFDALTKGLQVAAAR